MSEKIYIIGIDTGGTYTDGVLLEKTTGEVVTTAKVPTTHENLALGTARVLQELLSHSGITGEQVAALAVSSTLATNSVVENKGARVALLVIGYVKHFKLPVKAVVFIKGGHAITGAEEEPLDLEYLVEIVHGLRNEVDAYGVCAAMSMHNPAHELVAEKAIAMIDPKPVFSSHRISGLAGMRERAATAGLHAKLMPVMQEYISGVEQAMNSCNLNCPMYIVGGNTTLIDASHAIAHAGDTVASGPACTAYFGSRQSSHREALVIDVGGTTTDITMVRAGEPILASEGCRIGGWQTHVEAVDMFTGGIGGDSHVALDERGNMSIGPARVTPLAMAAALPAPQSWLGSGDSGKLIVFRNRALSTPIPAEITAFLHDRGAATPAEIRAATGIAAITLDKILESLARRREIFECGFTPTDALHVLGRIDLGNRSQALAGARQLGRELGLSAEEFSERVLRATETRIENLLIDYVVQHHWGNSLAAFLSQREAHPVLGVQFTLKIPLIGIGAAAPHLLPAVAKNLGTTVEFPPHGQVGNGVGAALLANMAGEVTG